MFLPLGQVFLVKRTGIELHINQEKKKKVSWAPLVAQLLKNLPAMQTWVQSLGWEDPLEKGKATHSSILA